MVPTLVTYDALGKFGANEGAPETLIEKLDEVAGKGLEAISICRRAVVKLGFGTDLLGELHKFQREELLLRAQVETAFQTLHSATGVNAELLQMQGLIGTIQEGAFADFLVLKSDPLEDIAGLAGGTSIDAIYKSGRCIN